MIGVCSRKPRPSVDTGRISVPTGQCTWGKDVWHALGENHRTLCGIDASDFINMGEVKPDHHLCDRCRKKLA